MARITSKLLSNKTAVLAKVLQLPDAAYKRQGDRFIPQSGAIILGHASSGYSVTQLDKARTGGTGESSLSDTMTAAECYQWLQGALTGAELAGAEGDIGWRWNGSHYQQASKGIIVKWHGPTDHKGDRWRASCDGLAVTVSFSVGPVVAAKRLLEKIATTEYGDWAAYARPRCVADIGGNTYCVTVW